MFHQTVSTCLHFSIWTSSQMNYQEKDIIFTMPNREKLQSSESPSLYHVWTLYKGNALDSVIYVPVHNGRKYT